MNDELLTLLDGMGAVLDRLDQLGTRLDRIEAQQEETLAALAAIAETTVRTFAATGTTDTLPDEVMDAPILEQAMQRLPQLGRAMPAASDAHREALARLDRGTSQIRELTAALRADAQRPPAPPGRPAPSAAPTLIDRVAQRVMQQDRERRDRDREQGRDEDLSR
jgi:hypothetical protein